MLGAAGVASLLLQAPPPAVVAAAPPTVAASPLALRALLALPPLALMTLAALAGAAWAHRVGLRSVLAGTQGSGGGRVAAMLGAGGAIGLLLGTAIGVVEVALPRAGSSTAPSAWTPLAVALLYGGLAEEVLMRWGLMAALTLALARLLPRPRAAGTRRVDRSVVAVAVVVTSLVFAAAHLPALAALVAAPTAADVLRVLGLNTTAGVVYGALAWRHALESAMAAHAATHLGRVAVHAAWV
nr:CPBP family glutamic-type intramembrane protease [Calidifontimicrobium sp. SYSU G02091]